MKIQQYSRGPAGRSYADQSASELTWAYESPDDPIMREAAAQRVHELHLAELAAESAMRVARERTDRADNRRSLLYTALGIALVLGIIALIVFAVLRATGEDREIKDRELQRQSEVARMCIENGNQWVDGDCILTR